MEEIPHFLNGINQFIPLFWGVTTLLGIPLTHLAVISAQSGQFELLNAAQWHSGNQLVCSKSDIQNGCRLTSAVCAGSVVRGEA